ncbi:hypothetical protein D3C87_1304960 [compost metagenome]
MPFEEEHVPGLLSITRLSARKELLAFKRIYNDTEPRACIADRPNWNTAFPRGKAVVDDRDDRRFTCLRSTRNDVDRPGFELQHTRREVYCGPKNQLANLKVHLRLHP